MNDTFEMTLNSPMTHEDWAKLTDANMEHTQSVTFQTEGGKKVEFVKVKHGMWIDNKESIIGELIERTCSLCGHRTTGLYDHFFPYCPNCGAKMGVGV